PLPGGDIRTTAQVPPYPLALRRQLARRLFRADLPEDDLLALAAYNRLLQRPQEKALFRRFLDIHEVETQRLKALFTSQEQRRRESDRFSGKIEDAALRQWIADHFGSAYLWSVKSLEKMGVCPFDFFLSYCLGLEEFHLPEEEPPALDEGALLHAIAREFVEGRSYPIGDPEPARRAMDSLVEKHLRGFNPLPPAEQSLPLQIMRARISTLMRRFVDFEAGLHDRKPLHLEYGFGTRDEPLALSFDREKIALRGRFDRIDALDDHAAGYKVIDYKRGSSITSFAPSLNGHSLQMPIYILAAAHVLGAPLGDFKGGFYSFRSGEFKEIEPHASSNFYDWPFFFGLVEEPNRKCKAYQEIEPKRLTEIVQELVSQARQGYFPVEGRNKAKVPDLANLVGRWLEVPPEFEGGAAE
ncbi:MAG TPA: PD-(D/E)XK nuclease family protein, partial [Acidobacteriota bacterium]|nr:PD-(D/E)XK nuclease family protein [Acidobacteriota bacterium]